MPIMTATAGEKEFLIPREADASPRSRFTFFNTLAAIGALAVLGSAAAVVAGARGVGFTASLGSSKALIEDTSELGYKFGPGELYHQPFLSDNDVPERGIDLEACPSKSADMGIYQTVYNCLGGGSGCLTPESGCRDCTTNGDAGQYPEWLPICPCSVCVHYGLDYSKCDIDCPPAVALAAAAALALAAAALEAAAAAALPLAAAALAAAALLGAAEMVHPL